ncbi:tetratricopeptide repeat protein [Winogradskyella sp. A2]|uniref:tetratricopeptide repeat protein n=1 Tax=Winogradskyella sp. A2 TaxID=3366944 RepID=UPI00398C2672
MSIQSNSKTKWLTTLKFFAAYLVAAWTFLQFVDWVLNRYNISPYWVDLLLWIFIGIIPSLLIYFHHQKRINKFMLKKREKIIFPLNIVLIMVVTYFGFGNSDLGATTKTIDYETESGEKKSALITKEEFRIGIPIYGFENIDGNDSIDWWRYGIGKLLVNDLEQNKNISPDFMFLTKTTTKIREASLFYDFYVDGKYRKNGDDIEITAYFKKASNGKTLKEKTFLGQDFLSLIDEISFYITEQSGYVESNNLRYLDLPINEFLSSSEDAVREFVEGDYDEAVAIDSTFALAYLEDAKRALRYNSGLLEVQSVIDKANANKNKLPLQKQLEVSIQRNLAYQNYELAEEQVKLQLDVDPNNLFYNTILYSIYGEMKDTDKFANQSKKLYDSDPKPENGIVLAIAAMASGQDDLLLKELSKFEIINPAIKVFKIPPYIFKGNIEKAENVLNEVKSSYPEWKNRTMVYDSIIDYLKNNTIDRKRLELFEGHYRSESNEQTMDLWIANDRIIRHVKNQFMMPMIPASATALGGGFVNGRTWRVDLIFDDNGKIIGVQSHQYDRNSMVVEWYWKEDKSIQDAHKAYKSGDLQVAKTLYEIAYADNPKHVYLKNILDHINYVLTTDAQTLLTQHNSFVGNYGPRKFYMQDGKFYYKRKGADSELPKVRLLPLDENRYMDLTRLDVIMTFIDDPSGKMASKPFSFVIGEDLSFEWRFINNENIKNYFIKDD